MEVAILLIEQELKAMSDSKSRVVTDVMGFNTDNLNLHIYTFLEDWEISV
ncbi:MAG: hypothetical protein ACOC2R_06535 [Spirochaetota bacterium]